MEKACYGSATGPEVSAVEFFDRASADHKKKGIYPYCKSCQEIVHLYGVHTTNPNTPKRFDHANLLPGADPLDDCVLADRNPRFHGMGPDGWDDVRGALMRKKFFEKENLAIAYAFCLKLCRKDNLPRAKFCSTIKRADRKRIWSYVGIPLWAIPYILLTLENFTAATSKRGAYEFHFSFRKPTDSNISALWNDSHHCELVKLFTSSGDPVDTGDNPQPVSESALLATAGNVSWIRDDFLQSLVM